MNPKLKIALLVLCGYVLSVVIAPSSLLSGTKKGLTVGCNSVFKSNICNAVGLGDTSILNKVHEVAKKVSPRETKRAVAPQQNYRPRIQATIQAPPSNRPEFRAAPSKTPPREQFQPQDTASYKPSRNKVSLETR